MNWQRHAGLAVLVVAAGLLVGLIGGGSGSAQYTPGTPPIGGFANPTGAAGVVVVTVTAPATTRKKNCRRIKNRKKRRKCKRGNRRAQR